MESNQIHVVMYNYWVLTNLSVAPISKSVIQNLTAVKHSSATLRLHFILVLIQLLAINNIFPVVQEVLTSHTVKNTPLQIKALD